MTILQRTRIVLGVTGSIAAYKASDLASKLTQAGAAVDTILTRSATEFVGPLTFEAITGRAVYQDTSTMTADHRISHLALAKDASAIVVAPATAAAIARYAQGLSDDLLTATLLAAECPIVIAPAMESAMYAHPGTQGNLATLRAHGVHVVEPDEGRLASGDIGRGRLPSIETLIDAIRGALGATGPLRGKTVVVSAGGTREHIDPVRFVGNPATGKQGVALARAARDVGATVRLVLGASQVDAPYGVETIRVSRVDEMLDALKVATVGCHALIMNAAVGDFRPAEASRTKIKRGGGSLSLDLEPTPDLLEALRGDFVRVAFAAESDDHVANARAKLQRKAVDAIVLNDISASDRGFAADTNAVTILLTDGRSIDVPLASKDAIAAEVLKVVVELVQSRH